MSEYRLEIPIPRTRKLLVIQTYPFEGGCREDIYVTQRKVVPRSAIHRRSKDEAYKGKMD